MNTIGAVGPWQSYLVWRAISGKQRFNLLLLIIARFHLHEPASGPYIVQAGSLGHLKTSHTHTDVFFGVKTPVWMPCEEEWGGFNGRKPWLMLVTPLIFKLWSTKVYEATTVSWGLSANSECAVVLFFWYIIVRIMSVPLLFTNHWFSVYLLVNTTTALTPPQHAFSQRHSHSGKEQFSLCLIWFSPFNRKLFHKIKVTVRGHSEMFFIILTSCDTQTCFCWEPVE